jgi:hypothetical protein
VPSSKRRFGPGRQPVSSLGNLLDTWTRLASQHGAVQVSGWQGMEGSNSLVEEIAALDNFLLAYADDPPRMFLSAYVVRRTIEISVDYVRGVSTQIVVKLPTADMVDEVFEALEDVPAPGMAEVSPHEEGNAGTWVAPSGPSSPGSGLPIRDRSISPVAVKLNWDDITAEEFERILFNIVANAQGYFNPQWLMHTNAPDRGRDISVERMGRDALSGTRNQRVIIQAKHWLSKSIRPYDLTEALAEIVLWEPPRIHALVVATSGHFTADAVAWTEKHNEQGKHPAIEI